MHNFKPASWKILVVDKDVSTHHQMKRILNSNTQTCRGVATRATYHIDSAFSNLEAIQMLKFANEEGQPYAAAFIDSELPDSSGIEAARQFLRIDVDLPIVICIGRGGCVTAGIENEIRNYDQLLVLQKPFADIELIQLAAIQVSRWHRNRTTHRNIELLESIIAERTREIASTRDLVFTSLAKLAESRDPETGAHLKRIQRYTLLLLQRLADSGPYQAELKKQSIEVIARSSILHDIGKVGIPDRVLLKPGSLSEDEFEIMKSHTTIGADAIDAAVSASSDCDFLQSAAEIARCHHERFDGTGYPAGKREQEIPLSARVVAVADVFDALTSQRVYKSAMSPHEARAMIESKSGTHFDPAVVDAFLACWPDFERSALDNQRQCKPEKIVHAGSNCHILHPTSATLATVK